MLLQSSSSNSPSGAISTLPVKILLYCRAGSNIVSFLVILPERPPWSIQFGCLRSSACVQAHAWHPPPLHPSPFPPSSLSLSPSLHSRLASIPPFFLYLPAFFFSFFPPFLSLSVIVWCLCKYSVYTWAHVCVRAYVHLHCITPARHAHLPLARVNMKRGLMSLVDDINR